MLRKIFHTSLIFVFLFTSISCSAVNRGNQGKEDSSGAEQATPAKIKLPPITENLEKTSEENTKIDAKKLAKEAGYMIGWDIILAGVCKLGLHFSVGACLAADVLGDVGIILYSNLEPAKAEEVVNKNNAAASTTEPTTKSAEKSKFQKINPIEFLMGVGLMAITLLVI